MKKTHTLAHVVAFFTILVWGATFPMLKVLTEAGFHAVEIVIYRFLLAYIVLWVLHPKWVKPQSFKNELIFFLAGIFGVSLYFCLEIVAIDLSTASNISLMVATAPFFTGVCVSVYFKEKLPAGFFVGFVIAMAGIALVTFKGSSFELHVLGDMLALASAFSWAFYTIFMRLISGMKIHPIAATRRVFFYGLLTMPVAVLLLKPEFHFAGLSDWKVLLNLGILGVIPTAVCFLTWNYAIKTLGAVKSSVYIYLNPLTAIIPSIIFLNERITFLGWVGAALIIAGLFVSDLKLFKHRNDIA